MLKLYCICFVLDDGKPGMILTIGGYEINDEGLIKSPMICCYNTLEKAEKVFNQIKDLEMYRPIKIFTLEAA